MIERPARSRHSGEHCGVRKKFEKIIIYDNLRLTSVQAEDVLLATAPRSAGMANDV
jgi:hypothetical protein